MKVILVAGGTGGHVFPAIALAQYLIECQHQVKFIGVNNKMEAHEVPKHHIDFVGFEANGFNGSITNRIKCLKAVYVNMAKAKKIMQDFQPDIVVGFGGYICVPVLLAAHQLKVPTLIHEQNSVAGLANKLLGKFADGVVVCFEHAKSYFSPHKTRLLGSPRATSVAQLKKNPSILKNIGIIGGRPLVLIVMGSLGSESVNAIMVNTLKQLSVLNQIEIVYVTGEKHFQAMNNTLKLDNPYIHVLPFVDQLSLLPYLDAIVCRAGATTIAEISALKVPSIIIPSPYVAHNHQMLNASELQEKEAAIILNEKDLTDKAIIDRIYALCFDKKLRENLAKNMQSLGYIDATQNIYAYMQELIKNK